MYRLVVVVARMFPGKEDTFVLLLVLREQKDDEEIMALFLRRSMLRLLEC